MIVCAAIKVIYQNIKNSKIQTIIVHGLRHGDCYATIALFEKDGEWQIIGKIEGFVLNTGEFLNRTAAYEYAIQTGQLSQTTRWRKFDDGETELYSEDLY